MNVSAAASGGGWLVRGAIAISLGAGVRRRTCAEGGHSADGREGLGGDTPGLGVLLGGLGLGIPQDLKGAEAEDSSQVASEVSEATKHAPRPTRRAIGVYAQCLL